MSAPKMRLSLYRTLWGVTQNADGPYTLKQALEKIKGVGTYDGIESPCAAAATVGVKVSASSALFAHSIFMEKSRLGLSMFFTTPKHLC